MYVVAITQVYFKIYYVAEQKSCDPRWHLTMTSENTK